MATPRVLGHEFLLTFYWWKALPALSKGLSVRPPPATPITPRAWLLDEDAEVLTDIVEVLGRDLIGSDAEEIESMYKMELLEAIVVIKITSQQADLSSGDIAMLFRVPDHISDSCQRAILKVCLLKEKKYASAAGIELNADELNNELLGSEDDEGGERATEQNGNRSDEILELDFKL